MTKEELVEFSYMYRDGSNYKKGGTVCFANKTGMAGDEIDERLRKAFDEGEYFIARQIGVPEVFYDGVDEDDHCWHEYDGVIVTDRDGCYGCQMDEQGRDIADFVMDVEKARKDGWKDYVREVHEAPYISGVDHYYEVGGHRGTLLDVTPALHMWHITYDNRQNEYIYIGEYEGAEKAAEGLKHTVEPPLTTRARIRRITGYKTAAPDKRGDAK
jgi:hypothetical protein